MHKKRSKQHSGMLQKANLEFATWRVLYHIACMTWYVGIVPGMPEVVYVKMCVVYVQTWHHPMPLRAHVSRSSGTNPLWIYVRQKAKCPREENKLSSHQEDKFIPNQHHYVKVRPAKFRGISGVGSTVCTGLIGTVLAVGDSLSWGFIFPIYFFDLTGKKCLGFHTMLVLPSN